MIWQVGQRRELKLRSGESCAFQSSTEAEERGWAEEEEEEMAGDCMRMGKVEEEGEENREEEEKGAEAAGLQLTIAATGRLPLLQLLQPLYPSATTPTSRPRPAQPSQPAALRIHLPSEFSSEKQHQHKLATQQQLFSLSQKLIFHNNLRISKNLINLKHGHCVGPKKLFYVLPLPK